MKMHASDSEVRDAACTAISTLVKVSDLHSRTVLKHVSSPYTPLIMPYYGLKAWQPLLEAANDSWSSNSVAVDIATITEHLALIDATQQAVANEASVRAIAVLLSGHRWVHKRR